MSSNQWKRYFFTLLTINIVVIVVILSLLFWPVSNKKITKKDFPSKAEYAQFMIQTDKEQLNELINGYLEDILADKQFSYSIVLDDDVLLQGEVPIFSSTIPLSIHLEPYVLDDGNLMLRQKSISIGQLRLPNETVLTYVDLFLPIPDWVTIYPDHEEIYVGLTEMDIKSNFDIQVEQFDLYDDDIAFIINVPLHTFKQ